MAKPTVRLATAQDTNDLIDLVREAHEEERLGPVASFSEERVFQTILRGLSHEAVIGVIDGDGEIATSCFLETARPWYSATGILSALWFHSRSDYRKSSNSKALLTWARQQSERLNVPLQVEVPLSDTSKPKFDLFQRVLGQPAGFSFVHGPHPEALTEAPKTVVEPASPEDADSVIEVARELARENALHDTDDGMAVPMIRDALDNEAGVIGMIRNEARDIEATIFLRLTTPFYSREPFLDEFFAYVRPQYRKSK
jgi:hypothetical protein